MGDFNLSLKYLVSFVNEEFNSHSLDSDSSGSSPKNSWSLSCANLILEGVKEGNVDGIEAFLDQYQFSPANPLDAAEVNELVHILDSSEISKADKKKINQELAKYILKKQNSLEHNFLSKLTSAQQINTILKMAVVEAHTVYLNRISEIKEPKARLEVAKLLASSEKINRINVRKFINESSESRYKIAKKAVKQNPQSGLRFIEFLKLSEKDSVKLLFHIIQQTHDGEILANYINQLKITDPEVLYKIVKIALEECQNLKPLLINLEKYHFDHETVVFFLKSAAEKNIDQIDTIIEYFDLEENEWVEITKIIASKLGKELSKNHIKEYPIANPKMRFEIFLEAVACHEDSLDYIENYHLKDYLDPILYSIFEEIKYQTIDSNKIFEKLEEYLKIINDSNLDIFLQKIRDEKNGLTQMQLLKWFVYLVAFNDSILKENTSSPEQREWIQKHHLLEPIFSFHHPHKRFILTKQIMEISSSEEKKGIYEEITPDNASNGLKLISGLLTQLHTQGVSKEDLKEIVSFLEKTTLHKHGSSVKIILSVLLLISEERSLAAEDKTNLLHLLFQEGSFPQEFHTVQSIILFGKGHELKKEILESQYDNHLAVLQLKAFRQKIPLDKIVNFEEKFQNTFGRSRIPSALPTYTAHLYRLEKEERTICLKLLTQYCKTVLDGTFKKVRYDPEENGLHLERVFGKDKNLKQLWMAGAELPLQELLPEQTALNIRGYLERVFMAESSVDPTNPLNKDQFPHIHAYLEKNVIEDPALLKSLNEEIRKAKRSKDSQTYKLLMLEKSLIQLVHPSLKISRKIKILENFLVYLNETKQTHLLKETEELLSSLKQTRPRTHVNLQVVDSDDFDDLLLCGTEIASCQSVDDDRKLNKCLLAYLLDGKNRLIAIKNEDGTILGRSILRILWDKEHQKPALFLEKIYPETLSLDYQHALKAMAKRRAEEMGLKLYTTRGVGDPISLQLQSFGGIAPFEYVDYKANVAARPLAGVRIGSKFKIKSAFAIH